MYSESTFGTTATSTEKQNSLSTSVRSLQNTQNSTENKENIDDNQIQVTLPEMSTVRISTNYRFTPNQSTTKDTETTTKKGINTSTQTNPTSTNINSTIFNTTLQNMPTQITKSQVPTSYIDKNYILMSNQSNITRDIEINSMSSVIPKLLTTKSPTTANKSKSNTITRTKATQRRRQQQHQ